MYTAPINPNDVYRDKFICTCEGSLPHGMPIEAQGADRDIAAILSQPRRWKLVDDQYHASAVLPPGKPIYLL